MPNIDLTNGEQYVFGKVAGTAVILSGTDNAQATFKIKNRVEIDAQSVSTTGLILDQNFGSNTTPMIYLHNNSTSTGGDVAIEFRSEYDTGQNWRIGIDANSKEFKIIDQSYFTDTTYIFKLDTDGDAYIETDLHVGDDVFVGDNLTVADQLTAGDGSFVVDGTTGDLVLGENDGNDSTITVYEADSTRRNRMQIGADATSGFINATFGNAGSKYVELRSAGVLAAKHRNDNHFLYGLVSTAASYNNVAYDTSDSQLVYQTSTRKIKTNITSLDTGSLGDLILDMRPVSFNEVGTNKLSYGFIAEECAEIDPMLAVYGPDYVYNSGSTSFATASADTPDELKHINGSTEYLLYTTGSAPVNIN